MARYPELRLYIAGEWMTADGEPVINPADETVLGHVPHATRADLDRALSAAHDGLAVWRRTSAAKRAEILIKAANLVRERSEGIAEAMTLEQGKPIQESRSEVLRGASVLEWDANEGRRLYGRIIPGEPGMKHMALRQPVGVVAAFSPWNFPVASPSRKLGGALAAGCSIILKASEETPAGAVQLVQALADAGMPPGVVNLVFGNPSEISGHLIPDPLVRLVSFTGSAPVGKHLASLAGEHMKPCVMELGGHGPVIVCEGIEPLAAAVACVTVKSRNAGQVCVSPTRFFVHRSIYDAFVEAFASIASGLKVGNGLDLETQMGPLANVRRLKAMQNLISDAESKGARIMAGGKRIGERGFYFPLTVLVDVPASADVLHQEPFGPLALIAPFDELDCAIKEANSLPFGLAAYAFTNSTSDVDRLVEGIEAGTLSINHLVASLPETPFGGVKESGYGREGGIEGLEAYTFVKNVSHLVRFP